MKSSFCILLLSLSLNLVFAQKKISVSEVSEHTIQSKHLGEKRTYWISLPLNYSDSIAYPVIYVFDAEWRFELVKDLVFDLGANSKIERSIVVGIPHIDYEFQRGIDLTFSQSRVEYDGEVVDSTWYNKTNSGGGMNFYSYLTKDLIPDVNKHYSTNDHETLIGHSYGGYFAAYILSLDHPFEVMHIYDPSIWYSNGEVIDKFLARQKSKRVKIHLTYQPVPKFHKDKIEAFSAELRKVNHVQLSSNFYPNDSHNSLYLDSFYRGILKTHSEE